MALQAGFVVQFYPLAAERDPCRTGGRLATEVATMGDTLTMTQITDLQLCNGRHTRGLCRFDRVDAATIVVDDIDAARAIYLQDTPDYHGRGGGGDNVGRILRILCQRYVKPVAVTGAPMPTVNVTVRV